MPFRISGLVINVAYQDDDEQGLVTVVLCRSMITHCQNPNPCRTHKTQVELLAPAERGLTSEQLKELKKQLAEALRDEDFEDLA